MDKGATTSHVPTEAGAVPQEGPNYVIIGGSAGGGLLLLLIAVLVIRKCLCKAKTSSERHTTGKLNTGRLPFGTVVTVPLAEKYSHNWETSFVPTTFQQGPRLN